MKKILSFIILFYVLAILETTFFPHFKTFSSSIINLILIVVVLINLFEKTQENSGVFAALIGGVFWDIFSERPFGFYTLILLAIALFIKLILKKYVRIPNIKRTKRV
ncbi:MAG: rod shape-determining protein MreD [Candidatus Nealsonbacteria bacterium CG03_land_8_20_14_0_80_36_12]|uniref:Rod shape-determining protein MreD n=1 Tax=Candidatus Nealsonbacteria bacterium CG03_land_8_20_14_0_80_36_12 TaxID=1974701 RepID=A0A2M7BYK8_9BACT|nr:MAG: rod shape-determining protein MreD [Candidatus Nealsonbacteria bacterium CG03_land_8_20_14_0_80_36_12]